MITKCFFENTFYHEGSSGHLWVPWPKWHSTETMVKVKEVPNWEMPRCGCLDQIFK